MSSFLIRTTPTLQEDDALDPIEFNTQLAKLMQKLKKDAGAASIKGGYKGTGGQKHRRQVWVKWADGPTIDIFLADDYVQLGGVIGPQIRVKKQATPEDTYQKVVLAGIRAWMKAGSPR